jgi:protein-S-isoprenylcysteine O-methyltransferase Ste14
MNPLYGKVLILIGLVLTILIRIPHDKRNAEVKVEKDYKTGLEKALLILVAIGVMLLPVVAIFTPILSFADYESTSAAFVFGAVLLVINIWLFYRSHADLGTNWSKTLELRQGHKLVTNGVYRSIRHPMYTAIFLYVIAQGFLLPNWIAGPAGIVVFTLMYLLRVRREEAMMTEQFGADYVLYAQNSKRLIPFVY